MHKNVGVVSIGLDRLKYAQGLDALEKSGNNSGNMLFTEAVYRQISGTKHIGFSFDPNEVKENYDSIMIPASNWVNWKQDWGWLADLLIATDLPICVIGLGSQLDDKNISDVPDGTKRFLSVCSERAPSIGVRGNFTAEILNDLGIKNVTVLGCPSIFSDGKVPQVRSFESRDSLRFAFGPTRYGLSQHDFNNTLHRDMYKYAIRNASSIYFQSEAFEIALLNRENVDNLKNVAVEYYGLNSYAELESNLLSKGKFHSSLAHWISDVKKEDFYVGTRIHGVVSSTLAETPSLLITHDKRTQELADYMAVPNISINDFEFESIKDAKSLKDMIDIEKFLRRSRTNIEYLHQFYNANNLKFNRQV